MREISSYIVVLCASLLLQSCTLTRHMLQESGRLSSGCISASIDYDDSDPKALTLDKSMPFECRFMVLGSVTPWAKSFAEQSLWSGINSVSFRSQHHFMHYAPVGQLSLLLTCEVGTSLFGVAQVQRFIIVDVPNMEILLHRCPEVHITMRAKIIHLEPCLPCVVRRMDEVIDNHQKHPEIHCDEICSNYQITDFEVSVIPSRPQTW